MAILYMCMCMVFCVYIHVDMAISIFTHCKQTPLHLAAKGGFWQCMELLLEYGAKLNVEDMQRRTPRDHIRGRPKCNLVVTHHIGKTNMIKVAPFMVMYPLQQNLPFLRGIKVKKIKCNVS